MSNSVDVGLTDAAGNVFNFADVLAVAAQRAAKLGKRLHIRDDPDTGEAMFRLVPAEGGDS